MSCVKSHYLKDRTFVEGYYLGAVVVVANGQSSYLTTTQTNPLGCAIMLTVLLFFDWKSLKLKSISKMIKTVIEKL